MGNNNSSVTKSQEIKTKNQNILEQILAQDSDSEKQYNKINYGLDQQVNSIYNRTLPNDNYIGKNKINVYCDANKGLAMPYLANSDAFASETNYSDIFSSDSVSNKKIIEIISCTTNNQGNLYEILEKFAVNGGPIDHDCGANCQCIQETIEITGNFVRPYRDDTIFSATSPSPLTSSNYTQTQISPTSTPTSNYRVANSTNQYQNQQSLNLSPTSTGPVTLSPTSVEPLNRDRTTIDRNLQYFLQNNNRGNNLMGNMMGNLRGGATSGMQTSSDENDEITDSEEQTDRAFSTTSEISDTATSPLKKDNNASKKKNGMETSTDVEYYNEEEIEDETDDDNDDLEGLEDEDITEEGIILESDINTSDLYRMQKRIFASETETGSNNDIFASDNESDIFDEKYDDTITETISGSETYTQSRNYNDNNYQNANDYNDDDDEQTTEKVRKAMKQMNEYENVFDSEDRDIMRMNSSTDQYMKRPTQRNNKYN